jgi:pimeloyl-ACP methyl ester carboxylesterase
MDSKILMGLAIVLGLLALAFGGALLEKRDVPLDEDRGQLVDAGHFILEQNGARLLDESYTLFFHPVDGYMLLSQSELTIADQTVHLSQQTQYDRDFLPVFYQLAAETPSGTQIVSAQLGVSGLEMEVRVGSARQSAALANTTDLALLDNNLIGPYAVLLMAIRAEALDREFTAAIPQALLSLPARVEGPNAVTFRSDGVEYEGKRFEVHLGDMVIVLIEYDGRLVGLVNEAQATSGYDASVFPKGIEIDGQPAEAASGAIEREVAFASGELALYGTLAFPEVGDGPHAAALLIHGSGPVDRDGNAIDPATGQTVMALDVYRQLARALARAGIASLRFDKRGVGESDGDVTTASRVDLLDDVDAAIEALRSQPEIDAERILLIGHSEGGYLAPAATVADGEVAGLVLLAGAARPLGEVTRWQVETLLRQQGVEGDALEAALAQQDQYTAFVKASEGEWTDYTVAELRGELAWLTDEAAAQLKSTPLSLSWLREHYRDDPAVVLRDVDVPVLIINGEKDLQVPAAEAARLQELLEGAGNDDVTVYVLSDLNHLLRYHPEEPNLTYRHLSDPVDPRVIDALLEWVTARWIQ